MDPYYPPPPDEEQDNAPTLADLLAGVVASDASPDGTNAAVDDPRGYGVDYGGTPSPNDAGGTGVDTYGPPAPSSPGAPDWMAGMLGNNADAPGDVTATKPWDAVGPSYQRQDDATPEMPFPGTNTMLATPFGAVAAPAWLPFQTAKPVRPTEEQQQRVEGGQAPVQTWGDVVGGMTRFLQKQGESLPGNVGSQMMPEEQAAERARLGDVFGQEGEALIRPSFGADTMAQRAASAAERAAPALADAAPAAEEAVPASRFFHGTGSDFQTPTADKFDPNGLYGPGYYLTDSADVADSYAATRASGANDIAGLQTMVKQFEDRLAFVKDNPYAATYGQPAQHPQAVATAERDLASARAALDEAQSRVDTGPNVRAVDVPHDLNLLDAEAPASSADLDHVRSALAQMGEQRGVGGQIAQDFDNLMPDTASHLAGARANAESLRAQLADPALSPARRAEIADLLQQTEGAVAALETHFAGQGVTNHQVYEALVNTLEFAYPGQNGRTLANKALASMGYDGITYAGGLRIPMTDAAGQPIEHTAVAIFPESIGKVRNAISGLPGGVADQGVVNPRTSDLAARGLGALGGAAASQTGTDENTTWQERVARGLIGAEAGTRMGAALAGHGGVSGLLRAADDGLVDAHGRPIGRPPENNLGGLLDANGDPLRAGATDADWEALGRTPDEAVGAAAGRAPPTHDGIVGDQGVVRPPSEDATGGGVPTPPPRSWQDRLGGGVAKYSLGLLGNPASVAAIAIKNSLDALAVQPIAGTIAAVASGRPLDVLPQAADAARALGAAPSRFVQGFRRPLSTAASQFGYAGAQETGNVVTNAMAQFVRTHVGIQNAIAQGVSDVVIGRLARQDAAERGLSGAAAAQHAQETVDEARALRNLAGNRPLAEDAVPEGATPLGVDVANRAVAAGQRATYTDALGPFGQLFQDTVKRAGVVGQSVAPFTHIPTNAMAREVDTSAVGMLTTLADVVRGRYGNLADGANLRAQLTGTPATPLARGVQPLNDRLARNIVGAGITYVGAQLAAAGLVHVAPSDPQQAALFRQRGDPDGSVVIDGQDVPLSALGIPGAALKVGAEIHQAAVEGRPVPQAAAAIAWDVIKHTPVSGGITLLRALGEASHALETGGTDAAVAGDAVTTPEAQAFVADEAERWMPAGGALRAAATALDPYERQTNGVVPGVESIIPGLRNTLPVRTDATNRPLANPHYGLNALNPVASQQATQNPVLRVLDQHGVSVASGNPPPVPQNGEVPWTPGQSALYRQLVGQAVERNVTAYVGGPRNYDRAAAQPTSPRWHDDLAQAVKDAHAEALKDPRLASTTPELLTRLATEYDDAPTRGRGAVETKNNFALAHYKAWLVAQTGDKNPPWLANPRAISQYVALRPR